MIRFVLQTFTWAGVLYGLVEIGTTTLLNYVPLPSSSVSAFTAAPVVEMTVSFTAGFWLSFLVDVLTRRLAIGVARKFLVFLGLGIGVLFVSTTVLSSYLDLTSLSSVIVGHASGHWGQYLLESLLPS